MKDDTMKGLAGWGNSSRYGRVLEADVDIVRAGELEGYVT